mgnify:CR=1 FL=1
MKDNKLPLILLVIVLIVAAGAVWYFAMQKEGVIPPPPDTTITGTVLHLKMDGNLQATIGNTATVVGSAKPSTDAAVGIGSYAFDGTDGYINAGTSSTFDSTKTVWISAWVKFNSLRHSYVEYKKGSTLMQLYPNDGTWEIQGGMFYVNATNPTAEPLHWNLVSSAQSPSFKPEINKWYHVFYQLDLTNSVGPQAVLYINGQLVGTRTGVNKDMMGLATEPIKIGGRGQAGWDRNLNGVVDDVRVGNKAIGTTDIMALYNAKSTTVAASMVSVQ